MYRIYVHSKLLTAQYSKLLLPMLKVMVIFCIEKHNYVFHLDLNEAISQLNQRKTR